MVLRLTGPSANYVFQFLLKAALVLIPVLLTNADVTGSGVAFGIILLVALGFVWLLHHLEYGERSRDLKQAVLHSYLEQWLRDPENGFDPDGSLQARMNVMTPRHWEEVDIVGWRPSCKPVREGYLAVAARTRSMSRASDENLRLRKGQGCAGLLWEQDEHIAWALIDAANVAEEHNLTDEQAAATAHLTIVISCAIYSGRGDGRTLIGVLNLDAPTIDAVESWWDEQQHQVEPRIQDRLRIMAEEISERGYLPM